MGLGEDDIEVTAFDLNTDKDAIDLAANADTVRNIRIWDPSPAVLGKTFPQLQRVKDYYQVNDVDVDRYDLDGVTTQVVLVRARPQHRQRAPHLLGRPPPHVHARLRRHRRSRQRQGAERRAPLRRPGRALRPPTPPPSSSTQPAVYFGEDLSQYVVTASKQQELSFQDDEATQYAAYEGDDGVALNNIVRRAAFALRFGDVNPLISDQITGSSKILLIRDIRERVPGAGPVPRLRRRSLPGDLRRSDQVDHRRLHDHEPLSLRRAGRHHPAQLRRAASTTGSTTSATRSRSSSTPTTARSTST